MTTVPRSPRVLLPVLLLALLAGPTACAASGTGTGTGPSTTDAGTDPSPPAYATFTPVGSDPPELRAAWQRWQRLGVDDYELRVLNSCFCPPRPPVATTVEDGVVTSVRFHGEDRELARRGFDMDRLFLVLRDAYADADRVDARFGDRGVPYRFTVDPDLMAADEESYYTVQLRLLGDAG